MKGLGKRVGALVFVWLLLLGGAGEAWAQRYRVRVYNGARSNRTRRVMSNRAATRAALKRKKQHRRGRPGILRQTVN